jgi:GDP-D-mannose dehydratase
LHYGDLTDSTNLIRIIQEVQPDEIYNLAAALVNEMVASDVSLFKKELYIKQSCQ